MVVKRLPHYGFVQAKHHSSRRGRDIELVVLHYTAGRADSRGLAAFFMRGSRQASAHFGVGRLGDCRQMVDLDRQAWHAGRSSFRGMRTPPGWMSVGIEICNTGWAYLDRLPEDRIYNGRHRNPAARPGQWEKYTWSQVEQVQKLLVELKNEIPTLKYMTGHEDIRNSRVVDIRGSKTDPGPAWPWHVLKTDSIGLQRWAFSFRDEEWLHVSEGAILTH